ncbi:ABC transporter ATP-binding protein [Modestobacter sp. KNN46-3]|jgi:branched-chain amino acid transport system ATP-binding protein|uniref:ABC transporter ATP-binding protein n=1 Tax=Modestobacter sp. KNN46-3 TaxID=2711218 RepID=UPI0013DF48CB|nr:ABC transporter ATP-binding protein [Modestobacter sp. KNN46-3]
MSLEVRGLHAGYGRLAVLHGIDLSAGEGELVAVIGANGAGKTTLLRALSGLLPVTAGTVHLAGTDVTGYGPEKLARTGLAHVPENRLVFPSLSVADNLVLGGYTRRRGPASARAEARDRAMALFPRLEPRLEQAAGTLSGGEQQMLAIARGLMAQPRVLVLDEPSVGLAPRLVGEIFSALGQLRDDGLTLVVVEQNARAAFAVADRVSVMDRGRVVLEGDPAALSTDPRVSGGFLGGGFAADADADAAPAAEAPGGTSVVPRSGSGATRATERT